MPDSCHGWFSYALIGVKYFELSGDFGGCRCDGTVGPCGCWFGGATSAEADTMTNGSINGVATAAGELRQFAANTGGPFNAAATSAAGRRVMFAARRNFIKAVALDRAGVRGSGGSCLASS